MDNTDVISNLFIKNEKKLLKIFLLSCLHQLFCDQFINLMQSDDNNHPLECYTMDTKITQLLIHGIVESGEYTLEGIALHTRIPVDVIYDAVFGKLNQITITPWSRIVGLYLQVKPEISKKVFERLIEYPAIPLLLSEG